MKTTISVSEMMNNMVPISRFNKGEASKIFEELKECGTKIVIKNNTPVCVLITPEEYTSMMKALEDCALYSKKEEQQGEEQVD